ncbi:MAG: DEAD/DEAH box helicase [Campylobacterota bacterium]|nr:DEAD/DEAH box helicase [Campylobacterota bacterium]
MFVSSFAFIFIHFSLLFRYHFFMKTLQITKTDILNNFDDGAYSRGYGYYKNNHVVDYQIYGSVFEGFKVLSKVDGSRVYTQNITFSHLDNMHIEAECSCPVGYGCKHAVAVLFQMMKNQNLVHRKSDAKLWLDTFLNIQKSKQAVVVPNREHFLIFRIFEHTHTDFEFYKAKILKNGNLSKGTKLAKDNMFYYVQYDWKYEFLTDKDRELINYLTNTENQRDNYQFEDEYGFLMLKKLCETKRCFFGKNNKPLSFVNLPKTLNFEWVESDEISSLEHNLSENEFLIHQTIPPLCIDTQNNTMYQIHTQYSTEELECMLKAPTFSKDEVEKVIEEVVSKTPDVAFPLPKSFEIEEITTSPKPLLYLYAEQNENHSIHIMELHFAYGEYDMNAYPLNESELLFYDTKRIKVIRDNQLESTYINTLESLGFIYESQVKGYLSFAKPSMQEAIERWRIFIDEKVTILREEGWEIEIDPSFNFNFEYVDNISVDTTESSENSSWFELSYSVDIGGRSVALLPIVVSLLDEFDSIDSLPPKLNLSLEKGTFLHVDTEEIRPIMKTIFELYDKVEEDKLLIKPYDAHILDFDAQSHVTWKGSSELQALSKKLKDFQGIKSVEPSTHLNAQLREYQQFGLNWLNFLHSFNFAGILADDMGLGKTVQTLAFLQLLKEESKITKPVLIVMPTSLIGNWKNEINKFTENLSYLELYGIDRADKFKKINTYDIILTTYGLVQRDKEKYDKEHFSYIILDEAQKIKNPKTKLAQAIKGLHATNRLALSGTPIENHLGELWSIFDFLMPGFLESLSYFKSYYQNPIEQENSITKQNVLNKKIAPFILRRTKNEVVAELPPKTEIIKKAIFGKKQATLYENIRITMEEKVRDAIKGKGLSRSHITILDALLKLRQVCCHPSLLKLESAKGIKESTKLAMFLELIDELHAEGRKVLVFSQFTTMLTILENEIKKLNIPYTKLTGATRKREEAIDKFTKGDAEIFLISLKAGGVGLNLVEADTVIHYDPWWNPAVENQATDRAYRIGQDKAVFVYKLIVENSIEEKILELQEKKKSLQDGIYKDKKDKEEKFSGDELVELLKI